jgi:hypothetical protein
MKSPCLKCDKLHRDKKNEECEKCEKRWEYVKYENSQYFLTELNIES